MQTILNYGVAFFQVVVLNCAQPDNWKYCYRVDQWLIPDLVHGWELRSGKIQPYQTEKEILERLGTQDKPLPNSK